MKSEVRVMQMKGERSEIWMGMKKCWLAKCLVVCELEAKEPLKEKKNTRQDRTGTD